MGNVTYHTRPVWLSQTTAATLFSGTAGSVSRSSGLGWAVSESVNLGHYAGCKVHP
jgi:hypothetical protein